MIEKTRGIVVKTTKYSETSLVVKVFTELFGMRTYMVRGVRKKKSRNPINLFQPLSLLDLIVYEKPGRDIQNIKELKSAHIYSTIPYEIKKSSMVLFLNEVIYKSIQEEENNQELFQFLFESLIFLDEAKENYQNFHLSFIIHLTRFLGFEPSDNFLVNQEVFDLQEGRYTTLDLPESASIKPPLSDIFFQLSTSNNWNEVIKINRQQRQILIDKVIQYYQFHLNGFPEMKTLAVLHDVMG